MALVALAAVSSAAVSAEPVAIVVETQKGQPIEGAVITVRAGEGGESVSSTVTSDEGVAVVHELGNGEWYFEIDRPGYMLYTAYVLVRIGKKPELGFASQVSRGDDWEPMRVKIREASKKLVRRADVTAPPEPRIRQTVRVETPEREPAETGGDTAETAEVDTRPDQRRVGEPTSEPQAGASETETVAVPSTVETVVPETEAPQAEAPPDLKVADGDPEPLAEETTPSSTAEVQSTELEDRPEPAAEPTPASPEATPEPDEAGIAASPPDLQPPAEPPRQSEPTSQPEPVAPQPIESPTADTSTTTTPSPSARSGFDAAASRFLRSNAAGDCPECGAGEWAVSAGVQAATAGDTRSTSTCPDELGEQVARFAESLAGRPQRPFAGPLMAALWRTADDTERAELAEIGTRMLGPEGFCQVAGVVLPAGATMTGYALEAWDELGGRSCSAQGICALPKAGWSGEPRVVSGDQATVIYSVFRNRSTRHQRNAELTVLFTPPAEWQ